MPVLLLAFAALFLAAWLFYAPQPPAYGPALEILLLALLAVLFLVASIQRVRRRAEGIARREPPPAPAATATARDQDGAVVQFLGRLQEKGRLVDFIMEDITGYSNEQVGVAARVVHQGCREVLQSAFAIAPLHAGGEGEEISLGGDYDARRYRLVGKVPDRAPFRGQVRHHGWRTGRVNLPRVVAEDAAALEVIAPVEIEVGEKR